MKTLVDKKQALSKICCLILILCHLKVSKFLEIALTRRKIKFIGLLWNSCMHKYKYMCINFHEFAYVIVHIDIDKYKFVCRLRNVELLIHMINMQCASYVLINGTFHSHGISHFHNYLIKILKETVLWYSFVILFYFYEYKGKDQG